MATYIYKIKHNVTDLFSNGGSHPSWTKQGKVWKRKSDLSNHLGLLSKQSIYKDAQIIEYEVIEDPSNVFDITTWTTELAGRREVRNAAQERQRNEWKLNRAKEEIKRLEKLI